tara:strand:+ start:864 stop:1793 length:930 start_codon:yes stop_codon:yes gene_type:complete
VNKIPEVSVIMSVFNGKDFLAESIQSVLDQSFKNFEFIIIDDGSKDNSLEVIRSYEALDSRIRVFTQKNQGLAKSLNVGIENSKGKYIARIDADDLCDESRLQKQFVFMEENQSIDLIGSSVDVIDENGSVTASKMQASSFDEIFKKRYFTSPILHITFFGKRSFFECNKGYRENFIFAQDYDLVLRGIDSGSIMLNINEKLVQYRDFQRKINALKFIQQFRITQLAIKLSKERSRFGMEVSDVDQILKKIMEVTKLDIFIVNIFLKSYFLNSSMKNKLLKKGVSIIAFILSRDIRKLITRDIMAYKIK